jgi:hypothetical protein
MAASPWSGSRKPVPGYGRVRLGTTHVMAWAVREPSYLYNVLTHIPSRVAR